VQKVCGIILVLVVLGWIACNIQLPNDSPNNQTNSQNIWRRTVNGWEKNEDWNTTNVAAYKPELHPTILVLIQFSVAALVAFPSTLVKSVRPAQLGTPTSVINSQNSAIEITEI
jgi:hypothetical protein